MKIVCIGNSNVNGYPHKRSQCWVSLLRANSGVKVINKGINGDTTAGILERFDADVVKHEPEVAIILSGTNDFMQGKTPEGVLNNLKRMSEIAEGNGIRPIFLTPLFTDSRIAPTEWIEEVDYDLLNEKLKEVRAMITELDNIDSIDLQKSYKGGYVDGVHPDLDGHREIAQIVESGLKVLKVIP